MSDFPMVDVVEAQALDRHRLRLVFSDGSEGAIDLSEFVATGGPMVEPLRDAGYFARVFVSTGVPTWPNGFDLDAINLYMEMRDAGALRRTAVA